MKCGPENCPLTAWTALSPSERRLQRQPLARKLHEQGFTPEAISEQFGVSLATTYRDLDISRDEKCRDDRGTDTLGRKKSTGRPKKPAREAKDDKVEDEGDDGGDHTPSVAPTLDPELLAALKTVLIFATRPVPKTFSGIDPSDLQAIATYVQELHRVLWHGDEIKLIADRAEARSRQKNGSVPTDHAARDHAD
jgi:hypothetical protein